MTLTLSELKNPALPFPNHLECTLSTGDLLIVQETIRFIKGKRLVAAGTWLNKKVLVKIFFHEKYAKKHAEQEIAGHAILLEKNIPTPPLYLSCRDINQSYYVLLYEYYEQVLDLKTLRESRRQMSAILPELKKVIARIAYEHECGVLQKDLNDKNFLFVNNNILTIDTGNVIAISPKVSANLGIKYLAYFFSYFGLEIETHLHDLYSLYCKERETLPAKEEFANLRQQVFDHRTERWQRITDRIGKNSRYVSVHKKNEFTILIDTRHCTNALIVALTKANEFIAKLNENKDAKTFSFDGMTLLIRHYPQQRYFLKQAAALTDWQLVYKLNFLGNAELIPLASIKKKCGWSCYEYYNLYQCV